jgi:para-nitrobenzyl esterase
MPSTDWLRLSPLLSLLVLLLAGASQGTPSKGSHPPRVNLEAGALEGMKFGPGEESLAFLGVPYAAPPVAELRWQPPVPMPKWAGIRKAIAFGASCPKLPQGWLPELPWNEDCLYLNVWTPRLSPKAKLPVIVWFHGGGNTAGRSQQTLLGPAFSRLGLVVVSFNYRLGPLGFLAHPALTAESVHHTSGNYGLLDQLQALEWTRRNISRFGGDPDRITVMGHSAGAVDICLLMTSPLAKGLFQRAILQSGECQSALNRDIRAALPYNALLASGEAEGKRLADDLRVPEASDSLQRLRNTSAEEILRVWSKDPQLRFDAIVDGWMIPEQPARVFARGKQAQIPVIVGSATDEATVFVGHNNPKTVAEYRSYLGGETGKYAEKQFQAFPVKSDREVGALYLRLQNDLFAYGADSMARAMTRVGNRAYAYCFSYVDAGKRAPLGAFHGEELFFLDDSFPPDWERGPDEAKLGELMRGYWARFATTGDPNGPGLLEWAPYDAGVGECLELGRTVRQRPVPDAAQVRVLEEIMQLVLADTAQGLN